MVDSTSIRRGETGAAPGEHLVRSAAILRRVFADYEPVDFAVRLWDGSRPITPAQGAPRFTLAIKHPAALRRLFLPPSEVNLGEAFIFDDFDIEGDIFAATGLIDYISGLRLSAGEVAWLARQLLSLPRDFVAETARPGLRPSGAVHSRRRDRQSVQFHYDVSNDFYALFLDELMVYSCAYFQTGQEDLHTAQRQKLEHICRKLRLQPGERLLDIGCGWGGLMIYAAQNYGVRATGITLSEKQVEFAERRFREEGVEDLCEVRLQDYREVEGEFDKLVSVGMFEHVGAARLPEYFAKALALLKPGGLFLNHGIASLSGHKQKPSLLNRLVFRPNSFMQRYVFPDGELTDIHVTLQAAEASGFEVRDVEALREHYALTLRHWVRRLEENHERALQFVDEPTYRVWRIYMAASSYNFAASHISVYQALLSKNAAGGVSGQPWTRQHLYV